MRWACPPENPVYTCRNHKRMKTREKVFYRLLVPIPVNRGECWPNNKQIRLKPPQKYRNVRVWPKGKTCMAGCFTGWVFFFPGWVILVWCGAFTGAILLLFIIHSPLKCITMKQFILMMVLTATLVSCSKQRLPDDNPSVSSSSRNGSSSSGTDDSSATPPAAVSASFKARFGNLSVRQWKLRNDGTWRAHFTYNGVAWEATFSADGTLLKSERAQ